MTISENEKEEIGNLSILSQVTQTHPWLVLCGGDECEIQIFFSISKDRYYKRSIPEMAYKRIYTNCNEWLVLSDYASKECSLLNAITMVKVELPKYDDMKYCLFCNLTGTPGDPNCCVIFINSIDCILRICRPGDETFIEGEIQLPEEARSLMSAIFFDGNIYILLSPMLSLMSSKLNDPFEFQTMINGESVPKELSDLCTHHHLINSCGELLMVNKSCLHEDSCVFQVFRADFFTSEWVPLTSIGDRAIFLDPTSDQGISCSSSESGIQGNCIYYTEMESRTLYVFNLEDQSFTMSIPCPTISRINLTPHWVMIPPTNVSYDT